MLQQTAELVISGGLTVRRPLKSLSNLHIVHNIGLDAVAAPLNLCTQCTSVK